MSYRSAIGAISLAVVLCVPIAGARAFDDAKYPDFNGQWKRPPGIGNQFDTSKGQGRAQIAPACHRVAVMGQSSVERNGGAGRSVLQPTDPADAHLVLCAAMYSAKCRSDLKIC